MIISIKSTLRKTIPDLCGRKLVSSGGLRNVFPVVWSALSKNSTEVLCPENERIYIPGGIRQPVSWRADQSPSESSSFHHWTWICWLSLSHVHKLATHMITNMEWNKIGSPGTDGFTCWKDVLRACQIQVSAKFYLSSSSPSLRVTSGNDLEVAL